MTVSVSIKPEVLKWALVRSELSEAEIEAKFPKINLWLSGEKKPTLPQARNIAKVARLPLGRLLLDVPTPDEFSLPDFRTVRSTKIKSVGGNLRDVIQSGEHRLGWYAEYAKEVGIEPPALLGTAAGKLTPSEAADKTRKEFGWGHGEHPRGYDKVSSLTLAMEDAGLLVMRNSIVENSTSRKLDVHEFRGFTLRDGDYALVFLNSADSKTGQLFSLAHELGHVVRAAPGLSGDQGQGQEIERWCNRFAAALLMPESKVRELTIDASDLAGGLSSCAPKFGVSREALLWRLVDLNIVSREEAGQVVGQIRANCHATNSTSNGAPPFPVLVRSRVGRRFLHTVAEAATTGIIPETTAASFLGVRNNETFQKVISLADEVG